MSGLIILPILIAYILFALFMYKLTTSKIVLVVILLFPFWDLIIQKGIKTYYQVFESEPIIYAMPEFDKDGKIESLGLGDVTLEPIEIFQKNETYDIYQKINNFIEFGIIDYNHKIVKVFMKNKSYEITNKQMARYKIILMRPVSYFLGLYERIDYKLIDTQKKNKVLAEAYEIRFTNKYDFVRRNILWWQSGNGQSMISVKKLTNLKEVFKQVFGVNLRFNTNKGWINE